MKRPIARKILGVIGALLWVAVPVWVSAHHSSAMFDPSRSVTLQGVVKEFRWTNPHAFIQVVVQSEEWSIEMNSPEYLARAGWSPGALEAGDAVSLVIHPMRDNTKGGQYLCGTGPRGSLIEEPLPPPITTV